MNIYDLGYSHHLDRNPPSENIEMKNSFSSGTSISSIGALGDGKHLEDLGSAAYLQEEDIEIEDLINDRIDTSEPKILAEWTFGQKGAFVVGTANDGLSLSPTGLLARKDGETTFAIDSDGDATFRGTVAAGAAILADISANNITTGTLTGITIQTDTTGKRLRMQGTPANEYQFLDGNDKVGHLKIDDDGYGGYFAEINIDHLGSTLQVGSTVGVAESVYFEAPFISTSGRSAAGNVKLIGKDVETGLTWSGGNTSTWSFDLGDNLAEISSDVVIQEDLTIYGDAYMGIVDIDDLLIKDILIMNGRIEMNGNSIIDVGAITGQGAGFVNVSTDNLHLDGDEVKVNDQGFLYIDV